MNAPALIQTETLPALVRRAADRLASATNAAEVLEARDMASVAYDAAKSAARIARAKQAHDEVIGAVYHAQADALEIEAGAKRRLADEYDAAQDRGDVARQGQPANLPDGKVTPTVAQLGLTYKDVHAARQIRDAEVADPGVVRRTLDARLEAGLEPNKAALREAVIDAAMGGLRGNGATSRRNPDYRPNPARDAMGQIASAAEQIAARLEGVGPTFIIGGFIDAAERERSVVKFRAGRDALTKLIEACGAE